MVKTIDQNIVDWFNSFGKWGNLSLMFVSIALAVFLAGIIGFEREYHGHAAGLRTHILVALGSSLVMIISIYGFETTNGRDPARLAAQVVSGIGFLGAGTIMQTGTNVKGLTTATTLWFVMAIGLACGTGRFIIALISTILAFITLVALRRIEQVAMKRFPRIIIIVDGETPVLRETLVLATKYGVTIKDIQSQVMTYKDRPALKVTIMLQNASNATISAYGEEIRNTVLPFEISVTRG